jgi:putative membrane protein
MQGNAMYYHDGYGWWIVMMLGMVLFWAGVIVLIIWLARGATAGRWASAGGIAARETPREILSRRLAAGEITADEYDTLRKKLDEG